MGANGFVGLATIGGGTGEAERVGSVQVTDGFFDTLQVRPQLGRLFLPDDDRPGAARVVVLSDGLWRRRFGADPSIVGRPITFNAMPVTVIGVLPADFRHIEINPDRPADVFSTYRFDPANANRGGHFIRGIARLKDGVTPRTGPRGDGHHRRAARAAVSGRATSTRACASIRCSIRWSAARGPSCCCWPAR